MRLKIIACKALFRELSYLAALSENAVDITWMRQGFHSTPDKLRVLLQKEIDEIRNHLAKDSSEYVSIFKEIRLAIDAKNLKELSKLQQEMNKMMNKMSTLYAEYSANQI